jgi:hypothetical protein
MRRKWISAPARPRGDLASSGLALANPGHEYLVFDPTGGELTIDLSAAQGTLIGRWLNVESAETVPVAAVDAGPRVILDPPFTGPSVLYLHVSQVATTGS